MKSKLWKLVVFSCFIGVTIAAKRRIKVKRIAPEHFSDDKVQQNSKRSTLPGYGVTGHQPGEPLSESSFGIPNTQNEETYNLQDYLKSQDPPIKILESMSPEAMRHVTVAVTKTITPVVTRTITYKFNPQASIASGSSPVQSVEDSKPAPINYFSQHGEQISNAPGGPISYDFPLGITSASGGDSSQTMNLLKELGGVNEVSSYTIPVEYNQGSQSNSYSPETLTSDQLSFKLISPSSGDAYSPLTAALKSENGPTPTPYSPTPSPEVSYKFKYLKGHDSPNSHVKHQGGPSPYLEYKVFPMGQRVKQYVQGTRDAIYGGLASLVSSSKLSPYNPSPFQPQGHNSYGGPGKFASQGVNSYEVTQNTNNPQIDTSKTLESLMQMKPPGPRPAAMFYRHPPKSPPHRLIQQQIQYVAQQQQPLTQYKRPSYTLPNSAVLESQAEASQASSYYPQSLTALQDLHIRQQQSQHRPQHEAYHDSAPQPSEQISVRQKPQFQHITQQSQSQSQSQSQGSPQQQSQQQYKQHKPLQYFYKDEKDQSTRTVVETYAAPSVTITKLIKPKYA